MSDLTSLQLFAVYLGGRVLGCNIELHDVVFVVGHTVEETYPQLIKKWFGNNNRLHIDSYVALHHVDGHRITLQPSTSVLPQPQQQHLYFVNYGGYRENHFGELHDMAFYVDENKANVRKRSNAVLGLDLFQKHLDDHIKITDHIGRTTERNVDDIIELSQVDGYTICLEPSTAGSTLEIHSGYHKIIDNKPAVEKI